MGFLIFFCKKSAAAVARQRRWAAMTYMLILHMLKEAEQLRIDLVSKPSRESNAEREHLLKELQSLVVARAVRVHKRQQAAASKHKRGSYE